MAHVHGDGVAVARLLRWPGDDAAAADARTVLTELDKAAATATNIVTLVRVVQSPEGAPVDLDAVISRVVSRWETAARRRWSRRSSVGTVEADAERLEVMLDCLMENAVKFTAPDDSIDITARNDGTDIVIAVHDGGSGIAPEDDATSSTCSRPGPTREVEAGAESGSRSSRRSWTPVVAPLMSQHRRSRGHVHDPASAGCPRTATRRSAPCLVRRVVNAGRLIVERAMQHPWIRA